MSSRFPADVEQAPRRRYRWHHDPMPSAAIAELSRSQRVTPLVAELLLRRGHDGARAQQFLEPSLMALYPPETLPDVEAAIDRVRVALASDQPIWIYGDYDVDGISATALLVELFRHLGARVETYIPHRLREGYGVHESALRKIAESGAALVITVDGGSNNAGELAVIEQLGVPAIVTDHHMIYGELPTLPVVHPGRSDQPAPFAGLAGVGVAYKFVWALGKALSGSQSVDAEYRDFMLNALAFVALGTVADVVPLTDENRVLVRYGLRALARTEHPGLLALMEVCGIDAAGIRAEDIAFKLAPHLNAAGRLGQAEDALELLLTRDPARAAELAESLAQANRQRREVERRMLEECEQEAQSFLDDGVLVLAREGWHSGVAGIVAARLVDRYHRPAFVIALEGELGRGSIRSIPERPLDPLYDVARPQVKSIGGHTCAGGLTLPRDGVAALRKSLCDATGSAEDFDERALNVDAELQLVDADFRLVNELEALEPYGHMNSVPRFRLDQLELVGSPRLVGKNEDHLIFRVRQRSKDGRVAAIKAVYFRAPQWALPLSQCKRPFSMVVEVKCNEFRGQRSVELQVIDIDLGE